MQTKLGNFQAAAKELTDVSGTVWSRQRVERMFKRRLANGFPGLRDYEINGRNHEYFLLKEVRDWYSIAEAADILTNISGRLYKPAEIYRLWKNRTVTKFPQRKLRGRPLFDPTEVCDWYRTHVQDDAG
jgi:hypothetical protein